MTKEDGTPRNVVRDKIALVKEGLLYLFSNIRYEINDRQVESIYHPGQVQNMLSYLLEDNSYNGTLSLGHCGLNDTFVNGPDTGAPVDDNLGFTRRRQFILGSDPAGTFSFYIPLNRLFGFFRDYDKLIWGLKQRLIMTRTHDNDAIFKGEFIAANGPNPALNHDGKVTLSKVSWFVPHLQTNEKTTSSLLKFRNSGLDINLSFRGISCSKYEVPQGERTMSYKLGPVPSTERPRYLLLGFQVNRDNNQDRNGAQFDTVDMTNLKVLLNEKQYPTVEYRTDFNKRSFMRVYNDAVKWRHKFLDHGSPGLNPFEWKDIFPIFVIDLSKQAERFEKSLSDVTIVAQFSEDIPQHTRLFAVLISDIIMTMKTDGTRVILTS